MHLFLSPHLDDAVLSCGGTIHRLVSQGAEVTILTVMAGDPPPHLPDTPIVRDLHARWNAGHNPVAARRWEDNESAQTLGAQVIHREYPDCVYRSHAGQALYPDEEALFGDIHPDDTLPRSLMLEAVLFEAVYPEVTALYVPLGVGHHVDHQIVRDWGLQVQAAWRTNNRTGPHIALKFYEEYPYTQDKQAIRVALDDLKGHAYEFTQETQMLTAADIRAKTRAVACHRSQISTFWETHSAMAEAIRAAFSIGEGMYAERYWSLKHR